MFRLSKSTVACAIVVLLTACGGSEGPTQVGSGGGGVVTPPPPPPPPSVKITSLSPQDGSKLSSDAHNYPNASVSFLADAIGSVASIIYTLDGASLASNLNQAVSPGSHTACATAVSSDPTITDKKCSTFVVAQPYFSVRVTAPDGKGGEYIPKGEYVIAGPIGSVQDSVLVGPDGTANLPSRYAALGTSAAHIIIRGDPIMPWLATTIPSSMYGSIEVVGKLASRTVSVGDFAGQTFPISMISMTTPVPNNGGSSYIDLGDGIVHRFPLGRFKSFPVCYAFYGVSSDGSTAPITSSDSASFVAAGPAVINKKFGQEMLKACSESEVRQNGGISIKLIPGLPTDNGGVYVGNYGNYVLGGIELAGHQDFADPFFDEHELFHAVFGVGHNCDPRGTVMQSSCPTSTPDAISGADVANVLDKLDWAALVLKYRAYSSVAFAINGQRLQQGPLFPELNILILDENGKPIQ